MIELRWKKVDVVHDKDEPDNSVLLRYCNAVLQYREGGWISDDNAEGGASVKWSDWQDVPISEE